MFESAELGHKISKSIFREEEPKLRAALLDAQFELRENGKFPVVIEAAGPGARRFASAEPEADRPGQDERGRREPFPVHALAERQGGDGEAE